VLAGCRIAGPSPVDSPKVSRIGYIGATVPGEPSASNSEALVDGLRELGYVEGANLSVEWRATAGRRERVLEAAAELAKLNLEAIVVTGVTLAQALQEETRTTPIVIVMLSDPLESGLVTSLARPAGNMTGLGSFALELSGKQLQMLRESIPAMTRVGVLWEGRHPSKIQQFKEIQDAAPALGLQVVSFPFGDPADLASTVQAAAQSGIDAMFVLQSDLTTPLRPRIVELMANERLPAMYEAREWAVAGGLLSYGPSFTAMHRRAAYFVDRLLSGAAPADLPVERPREFELVINLKSSQGLGLSIPRTILEQATEVIQ
jgi:putative ABC transport system substrate-binding protein